MYIIVQVNIIIMVMFVRRYMNLKYICLPSYERPRIAGKKKVNAIKDGFLILIEILSFIIKK